MKILHFTYNTSGGAGKVARQLHMLFRKHGLDSALINTIEENTINEIYTIPATKNPARKLLNRSRYWLFRLRIRLAYPKKKVYSFHFNYNDKGITNEELFDAIPFKPDIIILHWIADFILPVHIRALYQHFNCPIIWRYNDLAPVTGGCHYPGDCERYKSRCGCCPALDSSRENDWSRRHWIDKMNLFKNFPVTIINSTKATEAVFKASPLFAGHRQEFIRNSLDQEIFVPADRLNARQSLSLPAGKKIIFWGATHITEPRKGFDQFLEALHNLAATGTTNDYFVLIGGNKPAQFNPAIPFPHQFTGLVPIGMLSTYYNAADVVVVSSREDGGPMMIVESLMCGTPVVAFATGLGAELVITGETGYRAVRNDAKDLTKGISYVLNLQPAEYASLREKSHSLAAGMYGEETEMNAYKKLFAELQNRN
jgi:glycosyltransferase involved in cell wall biosynthesis